MRRSAAIHVVALLLLPVVARALVLFGGLGTAQFTDPANGLPWANVGSVGSASGVYLGNFGGGYWVLTASHVVGSGGSLGDLVLDSGTYNFVPGSGVVVRNGDTSPTDLTLFRISSDPGLANLTLSTAAPSEGAGVVFVGRGSIEGGVNYWSVTQNPGADDDVWNNLGSNPTGADAAGYLLAGSAGKRWGQNNLTSFAAFNVGTGDTTAFFTTFQNSALSAQAEVGDSGGATFYFNGSSWELAGIMGAIATFENQPGSTAVLGNLTYSASVADYSGFITSAIPEPSAYVLSAGLLALGAAAWIRRRRPGRHQSKMGSSPVCGGGR